MPSFCVQPFRRPLFASGWDLKYWLITAHMTPLYLGSCIFFFFFFTVFTSPSKHFSHKGILASIKTCTFHSSQPFHTWFPLPVRLSTPLLSLRELTPTQHSGFSLSWPSAPPAVSHSCLVFPEPPHCPLHYHHTASFAIFLPHKTLRTMKSRACLSFSPPYTSARAMTATHWNFIQIWTRLLSGWMSCKMFLSLLLMVTVC